MTYKLYSHDGSGGFAVEAALVKARARFEIVTVDLSQNRQMLPEYVTLNPMHQVPALMLPGGTLMTESAAIVIHLSCVYPHRNLAPPPGSNEHGMFLRWMVFMSINLYEACLRGYMPERYTADQDCTQAVKLSGDRHMRRSFAVIADAMGPGPYLCGAQMSMADVYLAMLMQWAPEQVTLPALVRLEQAVAADAEIAPIWKRHGFK